MCSTVGNFNMQQVFKMSILILNWDLSRFSILFWVVIEVFLMSFRIKTWTTYLIVKFASI